MATSESHFCKVYMLQSWISKTRSSILVLSYINYFSPFDKDPNTFCKKLIDFLERFLEHFFNQTEVPKVLCTVIEFNQCSWSCRVDVSPDCVLLQLYLWVLQLMREVAILCWIICDGTFWLSRSVKYCRTTFVYSFDSASFSYRLSSIWSTIFRCIINLEARVWSHFFKFSKFNAFL